MTSTSSPVLLVVGAGPGLGMSVAHRFGRAGHAVALVSRSARRHGDQLRSLAAAGVDAAAFPADARDPAALGAVVDAVRERFGRIDVVWFGPGALDGPPPGDITAVRPDEARAAFDALVVPAVDLVARVLPEMRGRGSGGLLFAGGLSSVGPLPPLGALAPACAALRTYALTLHAALAPDGVYAGTLTVGGLIERGDIHAAVLADPGLAGGTVPPTLDPDELAETVWDLYTGRSVGEAVARTAA